MADVCLIAVLGFTGAGKAAVINAASGRDLTVGYDVFSCTQDVSLAGQYEQDGSIVQLIDIPEFDDTIPSDAEILKDIVGFLKDNYEDGQLLSGIVCVHSITQTWVTGTAAKYLRMVRWLCGRNKMQRLTLVTTMWSSPPTIDELQREYEIENSPEFFGHAIERGARIARFPTGGSQAQARAIIRRMLDTAVAPSLDDKERGDWGTPLNETPAGKMMMAEMAKLEAEHRTEMRALRQEFECKPEAIQEQVKLPERSINEGRRGWKGALRELCRGAGNLILGTVDGIRDVCHSLLGQCYLRR